jgi:tetratricopeptide (TPR) repeat protein
VISGAYYLEGDSIRFHVDLLDAISGNLIGSPEAMVGVRHATSELVGRLQQQVMGFLAMMYDERFAESANQIGRLPTYEAYQAFDEGMELLIGPYDSEAALPHFLRAFQLDSTFFTTLHYASVAAGNTRRLPLADSLTEILEANSDQLSEYDRHWMRYQRGNIDGDHEAALRAIGSAAEIAPQSRAAYIHSYLLELLNRPRDVLDVLAAIDPNRGGMRGNWLYWIRTIRAHHNLGEHSQEFEASQMAREQYPEVPVFGRREVVALAAQGRIEDAMRLLEEYGNIRLWTHNWVAGELWTHGYTEEARQLYNEIVESSRALSADAAAQEGNMYWLADALYHSERWAEARNVLEELVTAFPDDADNLGLLGVTVARLGNRERALDISERLSAMEQRFYLDRRTVWRARIAAVLGEQVGAVRLLQQAYHQGWVEPQMVFRSVEFESLRDHPEFQELMRPKG